MIQPDKVFILALSINIQVYFFLINILKHKSISLSNGKYFGDKSKFTLIFFPFTMSIKWEEKMSIYLKTRYVHVYNNFVDGNMF